MDQQSDLYTTVADWHVRTEKRDAGVTETPWTACCGRWVGNTTPLEAARDLQQSHGDAGDGQLRVHVYNGDTDAARLVLTVEGGLIFTPDTIEGFTEEGFQAAYGANYGKVSGPDDTLTGDEPQPIPDDVTVGGASAEGESTGSDDAADAEALWRAHQAIMDDLRAASRTPAYQLIMAGRMLEGLFAEPYRACGHDHSVRGWVLCGHALDDVAVSAGAFMAAYLVWKTRG